MEEKIKLTESQAKKFVKLLCEGDILGLEYLQELITEEIKPERNNMNEDIFDIIAFVIKLNTMVGYGEQFDGVCCKHYDKIYELYDIMKQELLNCFDNDFDKYFEEISIEENNL